MIDIHASDFLKQPKRKNRWPCQGVEFDCITSKLLSFLPSCGQLTRIALTAITACINRHFLLHYVLKFCKVGLDTMLYAENDQICTSFLSLLSVYCSIFTDQQRIAKVDLVQLSYCLWDYIFCVHHIVHPVTYQRLPPLSCPTLCFMCSKQCYKD